MDLREIKGIGPAKQQKLRDAGITTVEALARCNATAIATETGVPLAQVRELKQRAAALAVVQDAKGVGPASVPTFANEAVKGIQDALTVTLDRVAVEIATAQKSMARLQKQAQDAAQELAREAQTAAGRKRIAVASKELAVDYASRAQDAASKAIAYVQHNAPDAIASAKLQLQDAAKTVATLSERLQVAVKQEAVKIKASSKKQ